MPIFIAIQLLLGILTTSTLLPILLISAVTWTMSTCIGFTIATRLRSPRSVWAISPLLSLVLSFAPPIFYPMSIVAAPLRLLLYLVPTTYSGLLFQDAIGVAPLPLGMYAACWVMLILITAVTVILAAYKSKWREN